MPLYETVLQEKPPVVLEIGTAFTKLGFAAEAYPRFIIPTEVTLSTSGLIKKLFDYGTPAEFYDQMVDFLQMLFFKHVLVSPKDRKMVIVESVFCPTFIRETIAKALFKHFEVASVFFVPSHLVALSTLAVETAFVIDLGYKEASALPVYCGVQLLKAFQAPAFGAEAVHAEIKRQLVAAGVKEEYLTEMVVEDIKVRTCFVTSLERAQLYRSGDAPPPPPDVEYPIKEQEVITIPGVVRETAFEILFSDDNDRSGLPFMILESLLQCPIDMRKPLADNIFVIGGSSIIMGLMARLKAELISLLDSDLYKQRIFVKGVKFHKALGRANCAAWLGGSIYGGTDLVLKRSLTKEQYIKLGRVPDWTSLEDNRAPGSI